MHVSRDSGCGVKRNLSPHGVDVLSVSLVLTEKLTSSIGSVNLKAIDSAAVCQGEAHIMKHCTLLNDPKLPWGAVRADQ
jgi:hypothetical protein